MAGEVSKSKFHRSLRASSRAVPFWTSIPGPLLLGYLLFSPEVVATNAEVVIWNVGGVILFISTVISLVVLVAKGVPAFHYEYVFGEASRRTGLSQKAIRDIVCVLPYEYQWGVKRARILANWDRDSFEHMRAVGELHKAAAELASELRLAHFHAINAKTTGEPYVYDLPGAERTAVAKYSTAVGAAQPKVRF